MGQTLTAIAKQAARLLAIELFVPGGTLIVLAILLAGRRIPGLSKRLGPLTLLEAGTDRPRHEEDLVAYWGLRRIR